MRRIVSILAVVICCCFAHPLYITVPKNPTSDQLKVCAMDIKQAYPRPVVLDLAHKGLMRLEPDFFVGLANVQELYLQHNHLREIPPTVMDLQYLRILDCSSNDLQELPATLGSLEQLIILNAADNHIRLLDEQLGNLRQLRLLSLRNNRLRASPKFLGKLYSLQLVSLAQNAIQAFVLPLPALTRLTVLDLS